MTDSEWIEYYRFHPSEFEAFIKFAEDLDWKIARYNRENALLIEQNARLRALLDQDDSNIPEDFGTHQFHDIG